jgi:hypothetical protein
MNMVGFGFALKRLMAPLLFAAVATSAHAQLDPGPQACSVTPPPYPGSGQGYALYPTPPLTYPQTSGEYSVQYRVNGGTWVNAAVQVSVYGGSNSSPYLSFSPYTQSTTSMSFASIPVAANEDVELHVTKLQNAPFVATDGVTVRPGKKAIAAVLQPDGSVQIDISTPANFDGEQFVLWWNRDAANNADLQGLALFLDPPYDPPSSSKSNVKVVTSGTDLNGDLSAFDTLVVQGVVTINVPGSVEPPGAQAFLVPTNILNIYLTAGSWLQGKLEFLPPTNGTMRNVFGPGVLDVSRFEYDLRQCASGSGFDEQGYAALAASNPNGNHLLKSIAIDGLVIVDNNFYATDKLTNASVNNLKVMSWNGNNDGIELGDNTTATNVFVRSGDDSLKIWGENDSITNATVWQNDNGGVINLGWASSSPGDGGFIDGVYVVRTDWTTPTAPTFMAVADDPVAHQNNAVIASMMTPGTQFGVNSPPIYRNIYVDDPPQVLFSLKIIPPRPSTQTSSVDLTTPSALNLNIYNLVSPPSVVGNSIGFQNLPPGFDWFGELFPDGYTLGTTMDITLTDVMLVSGGTTTLLTAANAAGPLGQITPNGNGVTIIYDADIFANGFE